MVKEKLFARVAEYSLIYLFLFAALSPALQTRSWEGEVHVFPGA